MIPMEFKADGIVEILRDDFNKFGCVNLATEAEKLNTSVDRLVTALRRIDGVVCNESNMCCVSDVQSLAEKLRRFREDS